MSDIEHDIEIEVWALDEEGAVSFFGFDRKNLMVRVIKHAPETEREKWKYHPNAKLFGIRERLKLI